MVVCLFFFFFFVVVVEIEMKALIDGRLGMTMGRDGDKFYFPHPHTLLLYTYPLQYPYPAGMKNQISSLTSSGIPAPSLSPQWIIFFNENKSIFQSRAQCCNALSNKEMMTIDCYGDEEERGRDC